MDCDEADFNNYRIKNERQGNCSTRLRVLQVTRIQAKYALGAVLVSP